MGVDYVNCSSCGKIINMDCTKMCSCENAYYCEKCDNDNIWKTDKKNEWDEVITECIKCTKDENKRKFTDNEKDEIINFLLKEVNKRRTKNPYNKLWILRIIEKGKIMKKIAVAILNP